MADSSAGWTRNQVIGLSVFLAAVIASAVMIGMGVNGIPLPRWLVALAGIL